MDNIQQAIDYMNSYGSESHLKTSERASKQYSEMKDYIRKISVMISKIFPIGLTYVDDIQALQEIFNRYARLYRSNIEKDQLIFEAMNYVNGQDEGLYNRMKEMNDSED